MGAWKFRKLEASTVRGVCVRCNKNPQKHRGKGKYAPLCSYCNKLENENREKRIARSSKSVEIKRRPYLVFKKSVCEKCGFIPEHPCQLDVDHINGNHEDNEESNLQTLCANCHRLKTYQNKDWEV